MVCLGKKRRVQRGIFLSGIRCQPWVGRGREGGQGETEFQNKFSWILEIIGNNSLLELLCIK